LAISLVNVESSEATGQTSIVVALPADLQENDVVLVFVATPATTDRTLSEGGATWSKSGEFYSNDTRDTNAALFVKIMGAVPDTNVEITQSGAATALVGIALAYRGVDLANPLDVAVVGSTGINTGNPNPNAITPVSDNCQLVIFGASTITNSGQTPTAPANYTNRVIKPHSTNANLWAMAADRLLAVAGLENPGNWSISGSTTSDSYTAVVVALRPALAGVEVAPGAIEAATVAVAPSSVLGSLSIAPSAVAAAAAVVAPAVVASSITVSPSARAAQCAVVAPDVVVADAPGVVAPAAVVAASTIVVPTALLGSVAASPNTAEARTEADCEPTVGFGRKFASDEPITGVWTLEPKPSYSPYI
jgi:hypothetical protein